MALKAGRVGVAVDQVDPYGRLIPTAFLIDKLRELLDTESAELSAMREAREELKEIGLDEPIVQKPFEPVNPSSFPMETEEVEDGEEG